MDPETTDTAPPLDQRLVTAVYIYYVVVLLWCMFLAFADISAGLGSYVFVRLGTMFAVVVIDTIARAVRRNRERKLDTRFPRIISSGKTFLINAGLILTLAAPEFYALS